MVRDVWGKLGKYDCREAFRTSFHNYLCLCLSPLPCWLEVRDGLLYTIVSSPSSPFPALEKPLINMFEWMEVCVFSTGLLTKSEQSLCTVSLSPGSHGSADCGPPDHVCSVSRLYPTDSVYVNWDHCSAHIACQPPSSKPASWCLPGTTGWEGDRYDLGGPSYSDMKEKP